MNRSTGNINAEVFEELFDENFKTIDASKNVLGDFKIKKYSSISALKKATLETNLKLQKLPYELDVFIEKLTTSLFETVNQLKDELKIGNELTISNEHEKLLKLAKDFNELSTTIFDDKNSSFNYFDEENKININCLKQLSIARDNVEISIATLKEFNELINSSDLKQIISVSSMENELNTLLSKESEDREAKVAKIKQYKDILKQFESFYVAFVNILLQTDSVNAEQQLEQLVIS